MVVIMVAMVVVVASSTTTTTTKSFDCRKLMWTFVFVLVAAAVGVCTSHAINDDNNEHRVVVGIVSDSQPLVTAINATWWEKLRHPVEIKSGSGSSSSRVKLDLVFIGKAKNSLDISSTRQVSRLLRQESVSMVIGPYDLIFRLVTSDEGMPYFVTSCISRKDDDDYDDDNDKEDGKKRQDEAQLFHHPPSPHSLPLPPLPPLPPPSPPSTTLFLMPQSDAFHLATVDVIDMYRWEDTAVLYQSFQGLSLIGMLMAKKSDLIVRGWRLKSPLNENVLRDQLAEVRDLKMRHIVAVCQPEVLEKLMDTALRLSMLSVRYFWIFVHPMPTFVDYNRFSWTGVNFTTFSLLARNSANKEETDDNDDDYKLTGEINLTFSLVSDSLRLLKDAIVTSDSIFNRCSSSRQCHRTLNMSNLLGQFRQRRPSFRGSSSGHMEFDAFNRRTSNVFHVLSLTPTGLDEIGQWFENGSTREERLKINKFADHGHHLTTRPLQKDVNRVVTLIDPPFVMHKSDFENRTGNDRFEGFLVDLLSRIAEKLSFSYELYESPDGNYGSRNADGHWNGMIKELIVGNASLCLGAISITSDREEAVDFSKPFKQKMFNFLVKKPEEQQMIFQFLNPLSTFVWMATVSSIILVSLLLFVMDRFSPNTPRRLDADSCSSSRLGLQESFWFAYGGLVGGGTDGWTPRTVSSRLLTSAWWFFGLIIISSYTANLAAFLTVTRMETPIKSIVDLSLQSQIKYGTVKNTYAMSMFKNSQLEILQKMWLFMDKIHPDSMVHNTAEGIEKAKKGEYAFIWDAPINKYIAMHECDVIATGEPFDEKGYGIGMPNGASYRDDVTMAILNLGERGEILRMEKKWWGGGVCEDFEETSTGNNEELNMFNVAGVFLLLAVGALIALIACLVEFISIRISSSRNIRKKSQLEGNNFSKNRLETSKEPETSL